MALESNTDRLMSDINVTPFVDVMLVLLIIFMVTAPMMTEGVNVNLPQATAEALPTDEEQLVVSLDADNKLYINKFPVEMDSFREKLKKLLVNRKSKTVYLRADQQIQYGAVVKVMAEIKNAGVEKIGMVTVPPVKTGPENQ